MWALFPWTTALSQSIQTTLIRVRGPITGGTRKPKTTRSSTIFAEIAEFLIDGEIAVFMEVGAEKLRYCNGYAIAVHSNGEYETLNLDRIYDFAEQRWGKRPTVAEY
jgi:hypothetical protein